jgi:signal transduction histidine kinase
MSNLGVKISRWFCSEPGRITLLALLYVVFGRLILALDSQTSIGTPIFFIPEGIALAFVLVYGRTMAIGVFAGQLLLTLSSGAPAWQAIGFGLGNGLEALLASLLVQWLRIDLSFKKQRDFWLLIGLIILVLQPFSASAAMLVLAKSPSDIGSNADFLKQQWIYWWIGNTLSQSQLTPFLIFFLATPKRLLQRSTLNWAAKVMPILFAFLFINFYGNLNSGVTALGYLPLLTITPLTVATALRTNKFGLFCLFTSVITFGISALLPYKAGTLEIGLVEVVRVELRMLVICLISQAVNLATIQLQKSRDLATQRAEQLAKQLKTSLMAASLTHEVKQPIAAIRLAGQQLLTTPEENRNQLINAVMQSADELSVTTAKVHNLLRSIPAGLQPVDLSSIIELSLLQDRFKLDEAQVSLRVKGMESQCWIKGDSSQISLAISNLVRNSIQELHTLAEDEPRLLMVELNAFPSRAELSIGDNGSGFPTGNWQPTLFETTKSYGTGLGLYLVQQMADNHSAELLFGRSAMGGALVTIRFPR